MGIEFRKPNNRNISLYSLTDEQVSNLSDVFQQFDNRFKEYLDFYKDTRLYKIHIEYLIEICNEDKYKNNETIMRFKDFLHTIDDSIILIGD